MLDPRDNPLPAAPTASALRMYSVVLGVGVACALAIVAVHEQTKARIARNQARYRQRAVFDVIPGAAESLAFTWRDGRFEPSAADAPQDGRVHAVYDQRRRLLGVAIEAQGMGYQDILRVLYGYSPKLHAVVGFRVLDSRETPGLGDRIETDPQFLSNFERLDVRLTSDGQPAHVIELVKPGQKQNPWQVDAISGATITSQAVADMLRDSTALWIRRVQQRQADLQHPSPD